MPHKDPTKRRKYLKSWQTANRKKQRVYLQQWREKNPDSTARYYARIDKERVGAAKSARRLKITYGITADQWWAMFCAQGLRCAICRTNEPNGANSQWCTDHDHKTGHVRGILCSSCNTMLGHAKDSAAVLRYAADYLEGPEW